MSILDELREKLEDISVVDPHDTTVGDLLGKDRMDIVMEFLSQYLEKARAKDPHLCEFGHEVYSHRTVDGWCCACEADQAFMEEQIRQETLKARIDELDRIELKEPFPYDVDTIGVLGLYVLDRNKELEASLKSTQEKLTTNKSKEK